MIDLSLEARNRRRELARRQTARLSPMRKLLREIMESNALADIYDTEFTEYYQTTGKCPSCDAPTETPTCRCGCHRDAERWYQSHYVVNGKERVEDQRLMLWEWLENPFGHLMKGFVE